MHRNLKNVTKGLVHISGKHCLTCGLYEMQLRSGNSCIGGMQKEENQFGDFQKQGSSNFTFPALRTYVYHDIVNM